VAGTTSLPGEADAMDAALRAAFFRLIPLIEEARYEERGDDLVFTSPLTPFPGFCGVWAGGMDDDERLAGDLPNLVSEMESAGLPFSLQVRGDRSPRSELRAQELGLTVVEPIDGMLLRPEDLSPPPSVPGLSVEPVAEQPEIEETLSVTARGFEAPPEAFAAIYVPQVVLSNWVTCYLGRVDGEAVTAGASARDGGVVGIFSVATPPEHRRCGYASQLVAEVCRRAFADGATLAFLQASPMGSSVYRRLGFRTVERYRMLTRPPSPP
jgi:ribosomal protein S18 acetylase RimI-like enzyme